MYVRCVLLLVCLLASPGLNYADSLVLSSTSEIPELSLRPIPEIDIAANGGGDELLAFMWGYPASEFDPSHEDVSFSVSNKEEFLRFDTPTWSKTGSGSRGISTLDIGVGDHSLAPWFDSALVHKHYFNVFESSTVLLLGTGLWFLVGLKLKKR
jgi:hypothetical protein